MVGYNVSAEDFERLNKEYTDAVAAGAETPEVAPVDPAPKKAAAKKPVTVADATNG